MSTITELPIDQIKVEKGYNVRGSDNGDADFIASVKTLGVLVPVIVEQDEGAASTSYRLTAGHRRLHAATGLKKIPAAVRGKGSTDRDTVAAVENISREQLSLYEEAQAVSRLLDGGMTAKGVQQALGKSARWVTDRQLVLSLPEALQPAAGDGRLDSWADVKALADIAAVSPELAVAIAKYNDDEIAELEKGGGSYLHGRHAGDRTWHLSAHQVENIAATVPGMHAPTRTSHNEGPDVKTLGYDKAEVADVAKRVKALNETRHGYTEYWWPQFTDEDYDAARAAGVLWEDSEDGFRRAAVITDSEMYRQMFSRALERAEAEAAKKPKGKSAGVGDTDGGKPVDPNAAKKKALNEEIKDLRKQAHGLNLQLGEKLLVGLARVKLNADVAKYLASVAIWPGTRASTYSAGAPSMAELEWMASKGMRYVFPDYQRTVEKGKAKRQVVEYADRPQALKLARKFLAGAKTPEEVIGRHLTVIAAAHLAIEDVLPRSKHVYHGSPQGDRKALDRIVKPHLPRGFTAVAKKLDKAQRDLSELKRR